MDNETKPRKGLIGRLTNWFNGLTDRQLVLFLLLMVIIFVGAPMVSIYCDTTYRCWPSYGGYARKAWYYCKIFAESRLDLPRENSPTYNPFGVKQDPDNNTHYFVTMRYKKDHTVIECDLDHEWPDWRLLDIIAQSNK